MIYQPLYTIYEEQPFIQLSDEPPARTIFPKLYKSYNFSKYHWQYNILRWPKSPKPWPPSPTKTLAWIITYANGEYGCFGDDKDTNINSDDDNDDDCDGSVKSKQEGCREIGDYCQPSPLSCDGSPTEPLHESCVGRFTLVWSAVYSFFIAITFSSVHSLVTDHPHNPPLFCAPFICCLLLWSCSFS